jgi:hypothetical protein
MKRRRAFLIALAVLALSATAWAGSYLHRSALLLTSSASEADYLRARLHDRELATLIHAVAKARLEAAGQMMVPKEVIQAHPHLLLVLENYERAADAATRGEAERFLVLHLRARDEDRTFRSILKQLGYTLPEKGDK